MYPIKPTRPRIVPETATAVLSPSLGHKSHLSPKPEWLYPGAHEAQIRPPSKYGNAHAEMVSFRAGSKPRSETSPLLSLRLNFPSRASFFAPRQAAPNMHCSYVRFRALLGHCDHPNNVRIPDLVMSPTQEPPAGQATHPLLPVSALSKTQYSLSPQFSGLMPPESEHDEEPSSG